MSPLITFAVHLVSGTDGHSGIIFVKEILKLPYFLSLEVER